MNYLARAHELRERIVTDRRTIHQNGGVSFDVRKSADYIKGRLSEMGIESHEIIDCGIVATIGKGGKTMLLRADYDALPLTEQTGLDFACTNGSCHACGHDFHASMLLGAAQMLKEREAELCGTVKLMFQPSEETIEGARPMIEAGVLENPTVDAAMAIHIVGGTDVSQTGTVRYSRGATYSAVDKLAITVHGKGGHGALPHQTIDPINITSEILTAIRLTLALEVPAPEHVTVTFGQIWGGTANNIIPNEVELRGTVRTYSPAMRQFIKERLVQVADIARIFGVPPHMIGHLEKTSSWGSGIEQMSMAFAIYTLRPLLTRIEQEVNRKIMRSDRYFFRFNIDGLLRGDIKTRYEAYKTALGGNQM
ncbi:MAG: amidohydrolase, partial [Clostridia bacterium]|nr:amidohydrolase [Clostridia bacterium]